MFWFQWSQDKATLPNQTAGNTRKLWPKWMSESRVDVIVSLFRNICLAFVVKWNLTPERTAVASAFLAATLMVLRNCFSELICLDWFCFGSSRHKQVAWWDWHSFPFHLLLWPGWWQWAYSDPPRGSSVYSTAFFSLSLPLFFKWTQIEKAMVRGK